MLPPVLVVSSWLSCLKELGPCNEKQNTRWPRARELKERMGDDGAVAASLRPEASQEMGSGCELQKWSPSVLSLK